MRVIRILFASLAVLGGSSRGVSAADAVKMRPNVLMIAVDDLADYVSILQNHPGIKTPNFDRIIKNEESYEPTYK